MKKFSLTQEETSNLSARKYFLGYIKDLIERDMGMYLYGNVAKRLNLAEDVKFSLSEDNKTIELIESNGNNQDTDK